MVGEINYSILDQNAPLKTAQAWDIGGAYTEGMASALARKQAQQSQQMNALALQKAERDMADEQGVRNALSGAGGDYEAAIKTMMEGGQHKQAIELKAKLQEQKTKQVAQHVESLKLVKAHSDAVFANPTAENAIAHLQQLTQQTGQDFSSEISAVQNMGPEQIQKWAAGHSLTAKDMMLKTEKMDFGGTVGLLSTDPVTGKVVGRQEFDKTMSPEGRAADARGWAGIAVAKDANAAAREVAGAKRTQDVEMKLADDYRAESKGFAEVSTSMKKVLGSLQTADKNAGSALAAGTAFMKILDPNSVVRESELGMALNASGWFDRASNVVNTMKSGKIMTPEQVKNLTAASNALFEEAKKAQLEVDASFKQRANSYGANPQNIITDRGQTKLNPGGVPSISTDADYNSLPPGSEFIAPDGSHRRKP